MTAMPPMFGPAAPSLYGPVPPSPLFGPRLSPVYGPATPSAYGPPTPGSDYISTGALGSQSDLSFSEQPGFFNGRAPAQPNYAAAGMIMLAGQAVSQAIGSFYSAKSQQMQLKMQRETLLFQSRMATRAAQAAYTRAQQIERAGQEQVGQYTMQAGAAKSQARAQLAARGVQAGKGSTAEIMATFDLIRGIDSMTITANSIRAANAERMRGAGAIGQAAISAGSAQAYGAMASSINPYANVGMSLLGSGAQMGMQMIQAGVASNRHSELMMALEGAG